MSMRFLLRSSSSVALLALAIVPIMVWAHPEARYIQELDWKKDHIAHVFAVGYTELGGPAPNESHGELRQIGERSCILGNTFGFDVDDTYAYDIDESVELTLTYAPSLTSDPFFVSWDQNGGEGNGRIDIKPESGAQFRTVTLKLDRARFADQGTRGIDIAVGAGRGQVAICDIKVERSGTTQLPTKFGQIKLTIKDSATGQKIPARVGIYDATGRAPMPSEDALLVQRFGDKVRMLSVNQRTFWPSANREAFYVYGAYEAKLPVGEYEIAVARGPEYRVYHGKFEVKEGGAPTEVAVSLDRYANLMAQGWVSGDDHVHLQREEVADKSVWWQTAAEDIHVANLLQMGNIAGYYFDQPAWGKDGRYMYEEHSLVSGQEDPRTGQLGHTIHENLQKALHQDADHYFLYHKVFEDSHAQGGVSGFAHLGDWFHAQRGLAITVPFGDVDFIEVCESGLIATDTWYGILNMGYKITPSAGSDFPYTDLPGVSRVYAKVEHPDNLDEWYTSMRAGHVYVTNGPFLEFTVNGHQMGDEIHVPKGSMLDINSVAKLNPDVDKLNRLELVVEGDVTKTEAAAAGSDKVALKTSIRADHSMWIAVRAFGNRADPRNTTEAHSAPIYVIVDDQPFWKLSELPQLVAHQRATLQDILTGPMLPDEDLEQFQTQDLLVSEWPKEREMLRGLIAQSDAKYVDLLKRAGIAAPATH